ncbi:MAG: hypothetical protein ABSG29_07360, partial [Steroidobacteraceae bacterium]
MRTRAHRLAARQLAVSKIVDQIAACRAIVDEPLYVERCSRNEANRRSHSPPMEAGSTRESGTEAPIKERLRCYTLLIVAEPGKSNV